MSENMNRENNNQSSDCCASTLDMVKPSINLEDAHWIVGSVKTDIGNIPKTTSEISWKDRLGSWKARWNISRMVFIVPPGLYAIGNPNDNSPVFVTANYKMSFDRLRSNLKNLDGWILVLDTKGINVWCAAGKGTFGTGEIVRQIKITNLSEIVSHRKLIVPQLGAVGVAAHIVKSESGFAVHYGPVRSVDIPEYLENNRKATPEMRLVKFPLWDRLVLVPVEIMTNLKYAFWAIVILLTLSGLGSDIFSLERLLSVGLPSLILFFIAYFTGTTLVPIFLPIIIGRAFALKGAILGASVAILSALLIFPPINLSENFFLAAMILIMTVISSFLGMNFTGSSTYTSLSGVKKEMKYAVPLQIGGAVVGLVMFIIARFVEN